MATESQKKLTQKQLRLIEVLLTHDGITLVDAGIKAGYSSAKSHGAVSKALNVPHVKAYYEEQLAARAKRTGIDADYVLRRLADIEAMDIGDIYNDKGEMLPIKQWPLIWRQMVKEVDMKTGKIKMQDKLKTIELMGKHIGVRAFAELVEVDVKDGFGERLAKARAKINGGAE